MSTCIRRPHTYWSTCPCEPCRADRRRKTKTQRIYGYQRPSAHLAWELIDQWTEAGFTATWIASAAGLPERNISTALTELRTFGKRRAFGKHVTEAILATDIWTATAGRCSATGTRRRLQALAVIGWDTGTLSERTSISQVSLCALRRGDIAATSPTTRNAVADIYADLESTTGPSADARVRAMNKGWHQPAMWDDPDIDGEPNAETRRDTLAEFEWLTYCGESEEQALAQLGVSRDAIDNARIRAKKVAA